MVLAESASSGTEVIVVQKGQFVLRGTYVRVGAAIRDLYEERMVVDVSSNEEHAPGLTKIRLGVPLRFFHPVKELVSTILLPSMELSMRLEMSDIQTLCREIIHDLVGSTVEEVSTSVENCHIHDEHEPKPRRHKVMTTVITSFEMLNMLPVLPINIRIGPSMRYLATWDETTSSACSRETPSLVSVVRDHLSDRKLIAYWEGLILQAGTSNKTARLGDVKHVIRWNGYLSLLLSTAACEPSTREVSKFLSSKHDEFQINYNQFRDFFRLPPLPKDIEEENDGRLGLPFAYLRKHFQILAQMTDFLVDGYKCVQAVDLLHRVHKDVQDHPPVVSEDRHENEVGLERIQATCKSLEQFFVGAQRAGKISWPQLVYFVRYNQRLETSDIFPSSGPQLMLRAEEVKPDARGNRKVAEVVSGMHTSRLLILYFDGTVEVWNLTSSSAAQEAVAQVLFSTKNALKEGKERSIGSSKSFVEAWMDANQTTVAGSEEEDTHAKRCSARISKFNRSVGARGAIVRFCAWDSVVCVNSSILQESGSGSFRFFRAADSFLSPIRQMAVEQYKVDITATTKTASTEKKAGGASSGGVIKTFVVTVDGSKIVFQTASDTVLWIACAGTGAILCHANLQAAQVGRFRAFFQITEKVLPSGEIETQLYATASAKSYRHVGMWALPERSELDKIFDRKKVYSFGKSKAATVVDLAVITDLLFIASRDGVIIVWSTTTDQESPIAPLVCLQIPLRSTELQSIACQSLRSEPRSNIIQVGDCAAADLDKWEVDVLQRFDPAPLRFALYLFDDDEIVRLPVPDKFDLRLVTLDDPAFEFEVFLAPVSGVERNPARRVTLQKHRIVRVLFIALHHSRDGIFAQKSVQAFFQDFEKYGILRKTHDSMTTFALAYQESVAVELRVFYRYGDSERVELTQPHLLVESGSSEFTEAKLSVLVIGATLKSRTGDQTRFQAWKFAMTQVTDNIRSELEPENGQLARARKVLALQSSYRMEAERLARIRSDYSFEEHKVLTKCRHAGMVREIKDGVRDIIAQNGQPDILADNLLKAVNVLILASFDAQVGDGFEMIVLRFFRQSVVTIGDNQSFELSCPDFRGFAKVMQAEEGKNVCFGPWLKRLSHEITTSAKTGCTKDSFWNWLSLTVRQIEASTLTTAVVGSLLVDLGLADAFNPSRDRMFETEAGYPSTSSLPRLMLQLHDTLNSPKGDMPAKLLLESTLNALLTSQAVVEFIVECTNFVAFFRVKMADLRTRVMELLTADGLQKSTEASYVVQHRIHQWQRELRELAQSQNELNGELFEDVLLEPSVEELQHLQRLLETPLPTTPPSLSSITLEHRCDTILSRNRFVMNAIGRLAGAGVEFVSLSVIYLFMETGEGSEQEFQQALTFLRKVQHLRVREYFLPAFLDIMNVPILPAANASMVCTSDTDEIRGIVVESLQGWSSLAECIRLLKLSSLPMAQWQSLLWLWSHRVLMAMLKMQNERFKLQRGVDMDMLLVSPDGSDLRLCSLAGGTFLRFVENCEDSDSLSHSMAKTFGCFIYDLLHLFFSNTEGINDNLDANTSLVIGTDSEDLLRTMRNHIIRLLTGQSAGDDGGSNRTAALTDFSSISQIVACRVDTHEGHELENLCVFALLALQPPSTRLGLEALWLYAGRPGLSEDSLQLKTLSMRMMKVVGLQKPLQKLLQDLLVCCEEEGDDDEVGGESLFQRVVESWIALLERLFQLKPPAGDRADQKVIIHNQIFVQSLTQILENCVPYQLCAVALRTFTQYSKRGYREQGRQAIQTLVGGYADVFKLIEAATSFCELQCNSLLMRTAQQVLDCVMSVVSGRMPINHLSNDNMSISSRFQRDTASSAVLWRLSEPCFRDLLAIDMASRKYAILLRWLDSRQQLFGFASPLSVVYEGTPGASDIALWWSDHTPLTPRHTLSSAAEDDLLNKGSTDDNPMTADYLRCVYETKEIEFKLMSGVSVPKFRLAALQQFFGPIFFERKRCFPMVFVRPLVARVWRDLAFDRLICRLLRDGDEKVVLGALSLLECSTRIFRFDALRSPRSADSKDAIGTTQPSLIFSCAERTFALSLCSPSLVLEVKRVLDRTTRSLKVLGESGTSSASRSQHPLVAILCAGLAWLVNCLYGGDRTTQFWGTVGIDQLIVAHCKANSLSFVKIKDSNMMNQVFRQGQRLAQQDPVTASKWQVFTSETAQKLSHRSSAGRNRSPFHLLLDEIVLVGSTRAVGLTRTMLLSRSFRGEVLLDDSPGSGRDSAFQQDLISGGDYGKVGHAIDLARDIIQLNGTTNEQIQHILYTKALFLQQTATSARFRFGVFAPVCKDIWSWMETAWRTIANHSMSNAVGTNEKTVTLSRAQGDVVLSGFELLHSIIIHPSITIEDITELTTFDAGEDVEMTNVLHEIFSWITNMPCGMVLRRQGSTTLSVLIECAVELLTNAVQTRGYDEVALATVNRCVETQILLEILRIDTTFETSEGKTVISANEKQKIWSMLLYFDSRAVTSRILDLDFLGNAVVTRLAIDTNSDEDECNILNRRLEAVLLLETLVLAASCRAKSVNVHMLFAEACKLLLHHDIIAQEAQYLRKVHDSSGKAQKYVAVSKRVMQFVCCLCIDFSSQIASRVFLSHLDSVGIPAWVVAFHQAQDVLLDGVSNENQLTTRVGLFWKDWKGRGAAVKSINRTVILESSQNSKSERGIVQTAPRIQRSASHSSKLPHLKKNTSVDVDILEPDDDSAGAKLTRPLVSVSPVKESDGKPTNSKLTQAAARNTAAVVKKEPSVIHTLLSIDADSALRLIKKGSAAPLKINRKQRQETAEDEEALDSDAYSPFPVGSSSEDEFRRAPRKEKKETKLSKEKKSIHTLEAKDNESKLERDSNMSSQTRGSQDSSSSDDSSGVSSRDRLRRPKPTRTRVKPAPSATDRQHEALRAIFRKYDVDGDGFISFIDLRRAMDKQTERQSHRLSDLEIQRWITEKDRGGQGVVSFEDFAEAFKGQMK